MDICGLFLGLWTMGVGEIYSPIGLYIDEQEAAGLPTPYYRTVEHYWPMRNEGIPDKPVVFMMVSGDSTIALWDDVEGAYMLPRAARSAPMTNKLRNDFRAVTDLFGIPPVIVEGAETAGDVTDGIVRHMQPGLAGVNPVAVENCEF